MRYGLWLALVLALVGCSKEKPAPLPVLMTPGSRLIYHDTNGHALWATCDPTTGAKIFLTHSGNFWIIERGCPDGRP